MAKNGIVDHSRDDVGAAAKSDIEHAIAKLGFENDEYKKSRHESKQDFVDLVERSMTRSTT